MTRTEMRVPGAAGLVTVDLYRDIHKGIRAELFSLTSEAGRVDPADGVAREGLAEHVRSMAQVLASHAKHEDQHVQPVLEEHQPALAFEIARAHAAIEHRLIGLQAEADVAVAAAPHEQRGRVHHLYLDLALFTATYLEHQEVEERTVMPALEAAIGADAVRSIDEAIVRSIPPDEVATGLSLMLPAMNLDDRSELLGGMQEDAPPEVFAGVWALAQSILDQSDLQALAERLGI